MTFPRSPQHRLYRFVQSFALRFDQYQWGIPTGIFCIIFGFSIHGLFFLGRLTLIIVGFVLIGRSSAIKTYYEHGKGRREIRRKRKELKAAKKKRRKQAKQQKNPPLQA